MNISTRARRGSGGVGILVRSILLLHFCVSVLDNSQDDILWIQLKHRRHCDLIYRLCCCYLPPENSSRGNYAQTFFDSLISQIYTYSEDGCIMTIVGDFNARIGRKQDFNPEICNISARCGIDTVTNRFGEYFLEFLNDCNFCVLNGRGSDPGCDTYTSISPKGAAVVDYICVPTDQLKYWSGFCVDLVTETVDKMGLAGTKTSSMPDHSIISAFCTVSDYHLIDFSESASKQVDNKNICGPKFRRYNRDTICESTVLFNTPDVCYNLYLLNQQIDGVLNQSELDDRYGSLVKLCQTEMNTHVEYKDINYTKQSHCKKKPWWNNNLKLLWTEAHKAEKEYRHSQGQMKKILLQEFRRKRKDFDRFYRSCERTYYAKQYLQIESLQTSNPREFWNKVKKLGPGGNKNAARVLGIILEDGSVSYDKNVVTLKWLNDISSLYNPVDSDLFDQEFYHQICEINEQMEELYVDDEGLQDESSRIHVFNEPILLQEVKTALSRTKLKKATGHDNLPNELLRRPEIHDTLCNLFNTCFTLGTVPSDWCKSVIQPVPKRGKNINYPLNHRCISLMPTIAKVYSAILNIRDSTDI